MAILHHTHPSFVRCLIPNEQKQPGEMPEILSYILNKFLIN